MPDDDDAVSGLRQCVHLLPDGGLSIIAERYQPIHHQLLALPGTPLDEIRIARSHPMALGQVRNSLKARGIEAIADVDTAAAARKVAERGDPSVAAVASEVAADVYGLEIVAANIEDSGSNTTRFIVLARDADVPPAGHGAVVSSYVFRLRSVPSALYKALGGFATNGLNLTKLESYMVGGGFKAAQHPQDHATPLSKDHQT